MSKLKSIQLAIELAERQRDDCAKAVAQAKRTHSFSLHQLDQLQGYAGDTDERWMRSSSIELSAELIRHHYQFMARLQQAIALQGDAIANSLRQVESVEKALLQAEYRLAGLNQVLKGRQSAMLVVEKRREQRATDEFAAMQHARNRAQAMTGEIV